MNRRQFFYLAAGAFATPAIARHAVADGIRAGRCVSGASTAVYAEANGCGPRKWAARSPAAFHRCWQVVPPVNSVTHCFLRWLLSFD